MDKDSWIPPFSIQIVDNFLDDKYYNFLYYIINNKNFYKATQGYCNLQRVEEDHKIRLDYTLDKDECKIIDKPFVYKANCNCNLRERWRLLYYNGESDKKAFRDAHTDWTNYSCHRRMSIIIGLSNPNDYEGGELVFKNNNLKYKIGKGSAVIFDSKLVHEVLPVTKGKRYVIQAFLFDDSGYKLKKEKNGIENFQLLGDEINKDELIVKNLFDVNEREKELKNLNTEELLEKNKIISENSDWIILNEKNLVHSRIENVDDCHIGNFKYEKDLFDYLNNHKDILYFAWHKPTHNNKKWQGRAYGFTKVICEQKKRTDPKSWPSERNMISGYHVSNQMIDLEVKENNENQNILLSEEEKNSKYLTNISTDGGPGNQIVGIKEAIIMAKLLNRKLLFPPILQHYVLNRVHRGYNENNIKYWKFSDIFEYIDNNMNVLELVENKHILKISNNQYFIRQNDITNPLKMESLLELKNKNKKTLNSRFFKNLEDYNELKGYKNEHLLTITHLYNSTAISECFWNGCDTCKLNPVFIDMYKEICSNLDFSQKIKDFGEEYINNIFGKEDFICLHLRYPDYGDVDIKSINKLYNENDINNLIMNFCEKEDIQPNNLFIATCNQNRILKTDLKYGKMLDKKSEYNEMESFIEQYIATRSKIFIYTGGIHAKPDHTHLRSTWSSLVIDYRSYLLNKKKNSNKYLTNHFS